MDKADWQFGFVLFAMIHFVNFICNVKRWEDQLTEAQ